MSIPSLSIEKELTLLVDTGATKTTILDGDARRLGISYDKLTLLREPLIGIGGTVETFVLKGASIYLGLTTISLSTKKNLTNS